MKIFVIRHGQTELNMQGLINGQIGDTLTKEGIEQVKESISSIPSTVRRIYASPLHRTKQTADIINDQLNLPLTFHDELMEVNFGVWNGTPYDGERKERHLALDYDWRPSGESVDEVRNRVKSILSKIRDENDDEEALVVSHGGIIRMIEFLETGEHPGEVISNASIHTFDLDKIFS